MGIISAMVSKFKKKFKVGDLVTPTEKCVSEFGQRDAIVPCSISRGGKYIVICTDHYAANEANQVIYIIEDDGRSDRKWSPYWFKKMK